MDVGVRFRRVGTGIGIGIGIGMALAEVRALAGGLAEVSAEA